MAFEQKELSGALFKNKRRTQPSHPDYTGQAKIDGIEYWVSAWIKNTPNGDKYMSMAYTKKDVQPSNNDFEQNTDFDNSDVPF